MIRIATPLLMIAGTLAAPAANADTAACIAIDTVPAVIGTPGKYCLTRNVSTAMTSGEAIRIDARDVTLDCGGFLVNGIGAGPGTMATGIHVAGAYATVRGCTVRGFLTGIRADPAGDFSGAGMLVEDNRVTGSTGTGVSAMVPGTVVRRNTVVDTGGNTIGYGGTGIEGTYDTEIVDNLVDGVTGADADIPGEAAGIGARRGGLVARNIVRNLQAASTTGIVLQGHSAEDEAHPVLAPDNIVEMLPAGDAVGIYCHGDFALVRGGTVHGVVDGTCAEAAAPGRVATVPAPPAVASACRVIASLPAVITTRGTYCLAGTLSTAMTGGKAVSIESDNVTLDCRDHLIDGSAAGPQTTTVGIAAVQRSGVSVRGCRVTGFRDGILLTELAGAPAPPTGLLVEGNRVHRVSRTGIVVHGDGSAVRGNLLLEIGAVGATGANTGIRTKHSVDVIDNRIAAVRGIGSTGVHAVGAIGATIAGNRVTNLEDAPGAAGLRLSATSLRMTVGGNTLIAKPWTASAVAIACGSASQRAAGNTALGFPAAIVADGCTDDGGNVAFATAP